VTAQRAPAAAPTRPRDVLSATDVAGIGLDRLLDAADELRRIRRGGGTLPQPLAGKQIALLFEKPSLRTRTTFDAGIHALGGHPIYLGPEEVRIGHRETAADVGRNLSRWVDAIVIRTFAHATLAELAEASSVPIINALDEREHPCQALADLQTIRQQRGSLEGRSLAFIGDGNNVCHSLLLAGALAGMHLRVATPEVFEPNATVVAEARRIGQSTGASVSIGPDPVAAVTDADAVYTDVWTSMGAEDHAAARRTLFAGFQVNEALMAHAPEALVMHCLPAHRGEEISAGVLEGPSSVVLEQAENRLYVQQALLVELLGASGADS
jgi:ornithine carbamoyltransferase